MKKSTININFIYRANTPYVANTSFLFFPPTFFLFSIGNTTVQKRTLVMMYLNENDAVGIGLTAKINFWCLYSCNNMCYMLCRNPSKKEKNWKIRKNKKKCSLIALFVHAIYTIILALNLQYCWIFPLILGLFIRRFFNGWENSDALQIIE